MGWHHLTHPHPHAPNQSPCSPKQPQSPAEIDGGRVTQWKILWGPGQRLCQPRARSHTRHSSGRVLVLQSHGRAADAEPNPEQGCREPGRAGPALGAAPAPGSCSSPWVPTEGITPPLLVLVLGLARTCKEQQLLCLYMDFPLLSLSRAAQCPCAVRGCTSIA